MFGVRNGESINCLRDLWLPNVGKLEDFLIREPNFVENAMRVSNISGPRGEWSVGKLTNLLPITIIEQIVKILSPSSDGGADWVAWKIGADGSFSNLSAYEFLLNHQTVIDGVIYRLIWSWPGPERGRILMWKISQNALMTNLFRWRRDFAPSSECPVCSEGEESISHLLRDCRLALQVWNLLTDNQIPHYFDSVDVHGWISLNLQDKYLRNGICWNVIFGVALLGLW